MAKQERLYLLQNLNAGCVGNSPCFWDERGGYSQWIDHAKRFSYQEARAVMRSTKGTHKWRIWPLDVVERCAQRTVDIQDLAREGVG